MDEILLNTTIKVNFSELSDDINVILFNKAMINPINTNMHR